uniref:Uncharacterized protein n=1 Tax=Rhizophora mucronata TaxID=61149 RepID=A0A2P2L449_RHIMU
MNLFASGKRGCLSNFQTFSSRSSMMLEFVAPTPKLQAMG